MYLFIDTLSEPTYICIFDKQKKILDTLTWPWKQKEFDTLTEKIDYLLSKNSVPYNRLSGIVVLVWPGWFTGTRVTTLVANTISYGFNTPLFPLSVNEFFAYQKAPLPWITTVTKKEVLLWHDYNLPPILSQISDLPEWTFSALSFIDLPTSNHKIILAKDYVQVIRSLHLSEPQMRISPLYAKDPNITLKKDYAS